MSAALFRHDTWITRELQAGDVPAVQALFDANLAYFSLVNGRPALPDEARQEFDDLPPAGLSFSRKWTLGLTDEQGALAGMAVVISDFVLEGTSHIGLFMVASERHGDGTAQRWYGALQQWLARTGTRWVRLAAIVGNDRAQRFWERQGFQEVRRREGLVHGERSHAALVMLKPLGSNTLAAYLEQVPRDRPGAD